MKGWAYITARLTACLSSVPVALEERGNQKSIFLLQLLDLISTQCAFSALLLYWNLLYQFVELRETLIGPGRNTGKL